MRIGNATLAALGIFGSLSLARTSLANEGTTTSEPSAATIPMVSGLSEGMGGTLLQLGLALSVILVLILVLQRLARRFGGGLSPYGSGTIEILAQRSLGNRLSLTVVQVMDQTLLLGLSPQGIERLSTLNPSGPAGDAMDAAAGAVGVSANDPSPHSTGFPTATDAAASIAAASAAITSASSASAEAPSPQVLGNPSSVTGTSATGSAAPALSRREPSSPLGRWLRRLIAPKAARPTKSASKNSTEPTNLTARAVRRRPAQERSSILNDIEVAAEIAAAAKRRKQEEQAAASTPEEFEREFRSKLADMKKKYPTLGEFEDLRA